MTDDPNDDAPILTIVDGGKVDDAKPKKIEHRGGDTTGGRLSGKQEGFARDIAKGMDNVTAYENNYSTKRMKRKTMYEEGCRLFANPKVAAKVDELKRQIDIATVHSGASLRRTIETELLDMISGDNREDRAADRIRCLELLGKSEKVGFFLDRSEDVTDTLTEQEVEQELADKLKDAFKSRA